jgi:hypothetical protein
MECLSWVRRCALTLLIGCCLASIACGGTILSPAAVLGSDLGTNSETVTPLVNMVNQSGLSKPFTSGATDFEDYLTTGDQPFAQGGVGEWWSQVDFSLPVEGTIDFDLGAVQTFERLAIWNRSLEDIQIHLSDTPGGPMTLAGEFTLPNQTAFFSYLPTVLEFDAPQQGRYLRIEVDSAYPFSAFDTFAYAIVGEIAIDSLPPNQNLAADFDNDGDVDGADLVEWRAAYAATAVGDADQDADSDGADFMIWQREVGVTASLPTASAVPEPAGIAALVAATLFLIGATGRKGL